MVVGKKTTRSYALSSLEMVKGKRIKTLREKREGGGRAGGESGFEPGQWELQRRGWRKMGLGSKL